MNYVLKFGQVILIFAAFTPLSPTGTETSRYRAIALEKPGLDFL